jgi:hypothetical protein
MTLFKINLSCIKIVFLLALFFSAPRWSPAQDTNSIGQDLTRELIKTVHKQHDLMLAYWLPDDFWRLELQANSTANEKETDRVIALFHPFTIVVFIHGKFDSFGGLNYEPEESIREALTVIDAEGNKYESIDLSKTSANLGKILTRIKPRLARMMGTFGNNYDFFVFPAIGRNGKRIADPKKEGTFTVQFKEQNFKWKLPLGSMLPPKVCPKCHENLSGAFKYCPYDGTELPQ